MAVQRVLLCSVNQVKDHGSISENVDDKYITAAIWEAQEFKLRTILGERLLIKLKTLVNTSAMSSNPYYEQLANMCSNYLSYMAMAGICLRTSLKVTNAGVVSTSDEKVTNVQMKDINLLRSEYTKCADMRCLDIQRYLLDNRTQFPELNENTKHEQRPNLHTMENCGIWLGGPIGRKVR